MLSPWQLRVIIATSPIAYFSNGTFEWHSEHLPKWLDALTAHGLCLHAAAKTGGVGLSALYNGTGGGHSDYPFTIMMAKPDEIEAQMAFTISKLKSFGFKRSSSSLAIFQMLNSTLLTVLLQNIHAQT